jgi:molybdopterin-binding protein
LLRGSAYHVSAFNSSYHRKLIYNGGTPISARNNLRGSVEEIVLANIMAHVVVRVGDNLIESAITPRSAEELKLKNRNGHHQSN